MNGPSLKLLVLKTRQLDHLLSFYRALGIEFVEEQHGKGPIHFAGKLEEIVLELYPLPDDAMPVDATTRIGLSVVALDVVLGRIESLGADVVTTRPRETPWGLRAVVRDPDGRSVELYQQ